MLVFLFITQQSLKHGVDPWVRGSPRPRHPRRISERLFAYAYTAPAPGSENLSTMQADCETRHTAGAERKKIIPCNVSMLLRVS